MYLLSWNAFQRHPELFLDIQPAPAAVPDWTLALAKVPWALSAVEDGEPTRILVAVRGRGRHGHHSASGLRRHGRLPGHGARHEASDPLLAGRQRTTLRGRVVPDAPDYSRFPRFAEATAHEDVIGPGEMLFVPPNWWHWLRATEKFITVSHNFFNQANARPHLRSTIKKLARRLLRQRLTRHST